MDQKKFESLGTTKIEESAGTFQSEVLSVFQTYPDKYFTQTDFVKALNKSNPFVNKTLRGLCDKGLIRRERSSNKFYYRLVQRRK